MIQNDHKPPLHRPRLDRLLFLKSPDRIVDAPSSQERSGIIPDSSRKPHGLDIAELCGSIPGALRSPSIGLICTTGTAAVLQMIAAGLLRSDEWSAIPPPTAQCMR